MVFGLEDAFLSRRVKYLPLWEGLGENYMTIGRLHLILPLDQCRSSHVQREIWTPTWNSTMDASVR